MKKIFGIFVALFLGIIMMFSVVGCNKDTVGTFYTLQEAYDNGWLTQADLMSIAYYHNGGRMYNGGIMSEDYEPAPKTPEVLSVATELKIKNTAAKELRENGNTKDAEAEGFTITKYYGTYNGCVAVMMRDDYSGEAGVVWTDTIAEVNIYYYSGRAIQIWREGKAQEEEPMGTFYTLQEAYDNGWLTQADLMSIAYYHNGGRRYNEEIMSEDYEPAPKTPEVLSKNVDLAIKQTLVNDLNNEYDTDSFILDNIGICAYYGAYNGGVAIRMLYSDGEDVALNTVIHEDTVDNVKFYYHDYTVFFRTLSYNFSNSIMFWKNL